MRPVTIKDVAKLAGVSPATASRVMSGHPSTSESARERVQAAAAELRFLPNAQARSLRRTRTQTIGLLVSDVRNPFFADLAHAVEQEASESKYVVLLANADESPERQDVYLDALLGQRVDGLIVVPQGLDTPGHATAGLSRAVETGIPMVFVDRVIDELAVPTVTHDTDPGISDAVRTLSDLGHERIGIVAGPQGTSTGRDRLATFRTAMDTVGLALPDELIAVGDFRTESGAAGVDRLLDLCDPATAIVVADSPMTVGAIAAIGRRGLRLGQDVSLVGYDDLDTFELMTPSVSTITGDVEEMGRLGVRALLELIDGKPAESAQMPNRFIPRDSIGRRNPVV